MARPKSDVKVRLSLEVGERTKARLVRLLALTEADSMTEVIRRALKVYETIQALSAAGRLFLRDETGKERPVILV